MAKDKKNNGHIELMPESVTSADLQQSLPPVTTLDEQAMYDLLKKLLPQALREFICGNVTLNLETSEQADLVPQLLSEPYVITKEIIKEVVKEVPVVQEIKVHDPLRGELADELTLLAYVREDADLMQWLGVSSGATEGSQLIATIASLATWEQIMRLWDKFAERCKQAQHPASPAERFILQKAIILYNHNWPKHPASLNSPNIGLAYHFEQHQRGNATGETIAVVWLPALIDSAGKVCKKPLVATR